MVGFKQTKETGDLIITESGRAFRFAKTAIGKGTLLRNIALVYIISIVVGHFYIKKA